MTNDPVWTDYVESVRGLARLPELRDSRRHQAADEEKSVVARARAELDSRLRRCDEWETLSRRAIATAEARMVAAKVLLPDEASTPPPPNAPPEELVAQLKVSERELDTDLASLEAARRRARSRAAEDAAREAALAARRKMMITFVAISVALVLAILVLAIALS